MGFDYAGKIRGLLAKADSLDAMGNEGEAQAFRNKAEEWRSRYSESLNNALAEDPTSVEPELLVVELATPSSELTHYRSIIADLIARHCDVRLYTTRPNWTSYRFQAVGFGTDLRYFEYLWTAADLMFSTRIDPHWDDTISPEENIFRMRRAGHTRKTIADRAWGEGAGAIAANRVKVQGIYRKMAAAAGEATTAAGLGFQAKDYRRAYAQAFVDRLTRRLREARDASNTSFGVVVVHGRDKAVEDAFYTLVPEARPSQDVKVAWKDPRDTCPRCIKLRADELKKPAEAQRDPSAIACREHAYMKPRGWTQADEARWQRQQNGSSAKAGRASGREAADGVTLRGTSSPATVRVEAANRALEG